MIINPLMTWSPTLCTCTHAKEDTNHTHIPSHLTLTNIQRLWIIIFLRITIILNENLITYFDVLNFLL